MSLSDETRDYLEVDRIYEGDARDTLLRIARDSIALSVWSPPYHVGKSYEEDMTFDEWRQLLTDVIARHHWVLKPGGFLAINIADILAFKDPSMPRLQASNPQLRKHSITRDEVLEAKRQNPELNRYQLAEFFGVSEQTIDRRLNGNNIRGGKHSVQTRVRIVGGMIENMALRAGLFPYDRRIWVKDPAWRNSRWASSSYRSVDEFEYVYIFWKPGVTEIDRSKLSDDEWSEWGSRAVWRFPSVRVNDLHEAMFPVELPTRCIRLLTAEGDTVLDCFMGSGTTAVAAVRTGRHYIGVDIQGEYVSLARSKVSEIPLSLDLSS